MLIKQLRFFFLPTILSIELCMSISPDVQVVTSYSEQHDLSSFNLAPLSFFFLAGIREVFLKSIVLSIFYQLTFNIVFGLMHK